MAIVHIHITNRRASFEYELLQQFEAGMVLMGSEIKSIRAGKANIADAYCVFQSGKLVVRNLHVSTYKEASYLNHEPLRDRILLLNKQELRKLEHRVKEKGLSIIPVKLAFNERGFAKLHIALARGKKNHDKRDATKEKDVKREMARGE
jgi:SsrA-binding protein